MGNGELLDRLYDHVLPGVNDRDTLDCGGGNRFGLHTYRLVYLDGLGGDGVPVAASVQGHVTISL